MTDEELVAAFEAATLDGAAFTHAAHVRVAWWYLRRDDFPTALACFSRGLREFAAAQGASAKYHVTITVAFMSLVAERLAAMRDASWPDFAARHPELLDRALLDAYYDRTTLESDHARWTFVLPRRPVHPARGRTEPNALAVD